MPASFYRTFDNMYAKVSKKLWILLTFSTKRKVCVQTGSKGPCRRSNFGVLPLASVGAAKHAIGLLIANNDFGIGIPFEATAEFVG